jgi:thioredoxin-related protein
MIGRRTVSAFPAFGVVMTMLLLVGTALPSTGAPAPVLRWEKDFKTATQRARTEGRIVMVDFWADWCTFCKKLDETTYKDTSVIARLSRSTVAVKVNTEGRRDEVEIGEEHGVENLPTIGFFTPEGRAVARIEGYVDADAFLRLMNTVEVEGADMLEWERVLRADAANFDALYGLGAKLYELNYHEDAQPLLERARKKDSGSLRMRKRVRMMLARIIETKVGFEASEKMLREGLALPAEPDTDPRLSFLLSRCLMSLGRAPEARTVLTKLLATYPKHAVAASARQTLESLR